ncbi:MAG TPA: hypothetical protein VG944_19015 [Fimbriimonas sp.]|nr:hypothetical protein [Fimbriimonas sp.]
MELIRSIKLIALAALAAGVAGCGGPDNTAVSKQNFNPIARDRDLPLDQRIQKIKDDKFMPEPEKERAIRILQTSTPQAN